MSYIIFGGSGFVGGYLTKELSKTDEVIICDLKKPEQENSKNVKYVKMDIRIPRTFDNIQVSTNDIVINLAANQYHTKVPKKNREKYFFDTNAKGTENILTWMEKRWTLRPAPSTAHFSIITQKKSLHGILRSTSKEIVF